MKEDGIESGHRNIGRLALAFIPWALSVGAAGWLGVWIGVHEWRKTLSLEDRAAMYTGAFERPKSKVKVDLSKDTCLHVQRADIDGTTLLMYAENDCHKQVTYAEWHWQEISPNRTILTEGFENWGCPGTTNPSDKVECKLIIPADDRTAVLRLWVALGAGQ